MGARVTSYTLNLGLPDPQTLHSDIAPAHDDGVPHTRTQALRAGREVDTQRLMGS